MNDEELKRLWQEQPLKVPAMAASEVISAMKNKMSQLRIGLWGRDVRELAACVIVGVVFGFYYFIFPEPVARLGSLITVAGSIFIGWRILHVRHRTPPAGPGATLVESLRAELRSVQAQSKLLGSIFWWYLLPLAVGSIVFVWGLPSNLGFKIGFTIFTLALDVFLYRLNQYARSTQLLPMEAQLAALLEAAETGKPMDETQMADLRPIVLSARAAGDGAKPVEFDVAFWQVALYGEIGFVGMWFFRMLDREGEQIWRDLSHGSMGFVSGVFTWQQALWLAVFFTAGLLFSWLIQKTTKRAVGISALGIHLVRGQVLILWDEIKEVLPLRVLNIRSLWLIRETGEKMIMPWTSLGRRAEVRAAVEKFAPANHPLRQQLVLLK
jgi:hypothetical protein